MYGEGDSARLYPLPRLAYRMGMTALIVCAAAAVAVAAALVRHTLYVKYSRFAMRKRVPTAVRVVHLTDLHGRTRFLNGRLNELVRRTKPDLIMLTGDLVSHRRQLERTLAEVRLLGAIAPVIFVPGNYEREESVGMLRKRTFTDRESAKRLQLIAGAAIVLANEGRTFRIGDSDVAVYGFDNSVYGNELYDDVAHAGKEGPDGVLRIMLAHSPTIIEGMERRGVRSDLLLAGHTHGGQVRLFGKTIGPYKQYHTGLLVSGRGVPFGISRGLGTVKLPVRWSCYPEIAVYEWGGFSDERT